MAYLGAKTRSSVVVEPDSALSDRQTLTHRANDVMNLARLVRDSAKDIRNAALEGEDGDAGLPLAPGPLHISIALNESRACLEEVMKILGEIKEAI